jgi:peptidoglycan/xylan/chitin deacetylase (PgdA/CDA1 family)
MKRLSLLAFLIMSAAFLLLSAQPVRATREKGVLVLAFDDGYASWMTTVAPELAAVGGTATGYVNNSRIHRGELNFSDLVVLQERYKWEIGTHTYHHFDAPDFVKEHGIEKWVAEEVDAAVRELQERNLHVYSLVFPFNRFSPELAKIGYSRFTSFRRTDPYPIANGTRADGSVPGAPIDVAGYSPVDLMCRWVDQAERSKQILFLYGHNVLPDSDFFTGHVAAVSGPTLTTVEDIGLDAGKQDLYLVPDMSRRVYQTSFKIEAIQGKSIRVPGLDLARFTAAGAGCLIGAGYGTRVSDFRRIIQYASEKLQFKTMRDGLQK